MLSRPPASFACASNCLRGRFRIRLRAQRRGDRVVGDHLRQSVRTEQQAIAGLNLERVGFDVHARRRCLRRRW